MSLLSENSATVLQYETLKTSNLGLGNPARVISGINFVTLRGKVDLTGAVADQNYPLLDLFSGKPLSVKGLLIWSYLIEANPPLVDAGGSYALAGVRESDNDNNNYDSFNTSYINNKYYLVPYEDGIDGYQRKPNEYSTLCIRPYQTVTSGTVYVTFVGMQIPV